MKSAAKYVEQAEEMLRGVIGGAHDAIYLAEAAVYASLAIAVSNIEANRLIRDSQPTSGVIHD